MTSFPVSVLVLGIGIVVLLVSWRQVSLSEMVSS